MMRAARDGRRMLLDMQARRAKPPALARAIPPAAIPPPLTLAGVRNARPPRSASSRRCRSARSCIDRKGCRQGAYRRPAFGSGRVTAAIWIGTAR
jgi:hypothetical protein